MTPLYLNTEGIQQEISGAAQQLQAHFAHEEGLFYTLEDLEKALLGWLELSIEALVEDALFHTVEGDRSYAFNRHAFELQMKRIHPVEASSLAPPTPQPDVEVRASALKRDGFGEKVRHAALPFPAFMNSRLL